MSISEIISWLNTAPQLSGETINWNYLPSYAGWSLTVPKAAKRSDILGNTRSTWQLKVTRRCSVQSNEERIALTETLEDLAAWAGRNPPPNTLIRTGGVPQFTSRNSSGVEDLAITLILTE